MANIFQLCNVLSIHIKWLHLADYSGPTYEEKEFG
jgi:hypothetical protein